MSRLFNKIYEDYFKKGRLSRYKQILEFAHSKNYRMLGIYDFYKMIRNNVAFLDNDSRYIINRHDIDTSPKVARMMFDIERKVYGHEGSATYYFRNKTTDKRLIKEIESFGYETGYHYEELADFEKKNKIKNNEKLLSHLQEIQNTFLNDIETFRQETHSKSLSVASHGDFVNTKIGIQNYVILEDKATRQSAKIEIEAYDTLINQYVKERFADHIYLADFSRLVIESIKRNTQVILILTHPRNWAVDIKCNTRENLTRLFQGILYRI